MVESNTELHQFCKNVSYIRKQTKLSKKEMARIMHISVSTLQKLESGTVPPRFGMESIFHLCRTFHIKPRQLFSHLEP